MALCTCPVGHAVLCTSAMNVTSIPTRPCPDWNHCHTSGWELAIKQMFPPEFTMACRLGTNDHILMHVCIQCPAHSSAA